MERRPGDRTRSTFAKDVTMSSRESVVEFVAGALVGVAMGCATVLLFTPKTGRQVRDSITKEARRLATKAYKSCGNLEDLRDMVTSDAAENVVQNIQSIRAAGL
jgi:gas vesicle protein